MRYKGSAPFQAFLPPRQGTRGAEVEDQRLVGEEGCTTTESGLPGQSECQIFWSVRPPIPIFGKNMVIREKARERLRKDRDFGMREICPDSILSTVSKPQITKNCHSHVLSSFFKLFGF